MMRIDWDIIADRDSGSTSELSWSASSWHSATCTAGGDGRFCGCQSRRDDIRPIPTPAIKGKRPKYDPHNARQLWQPEALAMTSKPGKRPCKQVEFNQVSKRRPVRPRYLSRKR